MRPIKSLHSEARIVNANGETLTNKVAEPMTGSDANTHDSLPMSTTMGRIWCQSQRLIVSAREKRQFET